MTKAIAPTAATAPIIPNPPPITAESSCCTDLFLRVQAVWNAFLTLLVAIVDWCACQIHGPTGKSQPLVIDWEERLPRRAPIRLPRDLYPKTAEEKAEETLKNQIEIFDRMPSLGRFLKSYIPEHLPLQTRARQIKAAINNEGILFQCSQYPTYTAWRCGRLHMAL